MRYSARRSQETQKKSKKGLTGSIIVIVFACIVLGFYYYMTQRPDTAEDTVQDTSVVDELMLRNMQTNYPPTPKEVVKYYCDISMVFYSGVSEDDLSKLAIRSRELFDSDLYAQQTEAEYYTHLKEQIDYFEESDITISSYALSPSVDVEYFEDDGYSFARLYCVMSLRQETQIIRTNETFLLRQDEEGHWKIFGFALSDTGE